MRDELITYFLRLHREHFQLLEALVSGLSHELLWKPNPEGVSIGHLIGHICEMEQFWIDWGLCGEPYDRNRQLEFDRSADQDGAQLLKRLEERCQKTRQQIEHLSEAQWSASRNFHGDQFTGAGILLWHIQHLALHCGHVQAHKRWQTATQA